MEIIAGVTVLKHEIFLAHVEAIICDWLDIILVTYLFIMAYEYA